MKLEVNCTFKAHIPQMVNVPGKLVLNDNILLFKAYGKEYTPFDIELDINKVVRYKRSKGLLGSKLFILYNKHEWYKFSHFSKEDLKSLSKALKIQ